jgi:biotin carboxyl carrier protein
MSVIYQAEIEGEEIEITSQDLETLDVETIAPGQYHVLREMKGYHIAVLSADHARKEYIMLVGDKEVHVSLKDSVEIQVHNMGLDEVAAAHTRDIIAPMPGLVLEVNVQPGDRVDTGDQLIILEAMKMENVLSSPGEWVVEKVHVKKGQPVDKSQLLITFE